MSTSKSTKSKGVRSLAKCYDLLKNNREKGGGPAASKLSDPALAGVVDKIDAVQRRSSQDPTSPDPVPPAVQQQQQQQQQEDQQQPSTPVHINNEPTPQPPPTETSSDLGEAGSGMPGNIEVAVGGGEEELSWKVKTKLAEALIDPQQLWYNFFSGTIMDDAADAVVQNADESEADLTHAQEFTHARKRGEHRFAGVCNFPLKLIFVPLKQGRRVANTFASILEMQFGPLHAALQVGNVILEWDDSSLVTPRLCAMEDQIMQLDMQPYSEWVKYTGKQFPVMKSAVEGLDYGQQIELIYKIASEKKQLIDALIAVIVKYNKYHYYNLFDRNCQHFVCDALKALKVDLPREFKGGLRDYYKALTKGKTPSVPSQFKSHSDLDHYVIRKRQEATLSSMPQHDLEFILTLYFRFHLESKARLKDDRQALEQWRCGELRCQMQEIEKLIDLQSMQIHNFKTIS